MGNYFTCKIGILSSDKTILQEIKNQIRNSDFDFYWAEKEREIKENYSILTLETKNSEFPKYLIESSSEMFCVPIIYFYDGDENSGISTYFSGRKFLDVSIENPGMNFPVKYQSIRSWLIDDFQEIFDDFFINKNKEESRCNFYPVGTSKKESLDEETNEEYDEIWGQPK